MTPRQQEVYRYVKAYMHTHSVAPTRKEIGDALDISRPTAELHLQALRDAGLLVLRTQWRGIFLRDGVDIDAVHKK